MHGEATDLPDYAVEVRGLSKTYRASGRSPAKLALDDVDLKIPRGSIFALLGPNGAGKSTLINILAGLVIKTGGTARIWDMDIDAEARNSRAAIGIVPQEINIDAFFTPGQLLDLHAGMYGVPNSGRQTDEILKAIGLFDKKDTYARALSGGMRRRLLVAKAMVHNPPVLVLDEPTAGVDIELRQQLWEHVRELNRRGTTVLLTTHYLEEAEELCDRIAIINHGKVIADDTTSALLGKLDRKEVTIVLSEPLSAVPEELARYDTQLLGDRRLNICYRPSQTGIAEILAAVSRAGLEIRDLTTEEADLEDAFLALTRRQPDATAAG